MITAVSLTDRELTEVRAILNAHLPPQMSAAAFGSRVGGAPKPWSDLDIVIDGPGAMSLAVMAALVEAFDESALPWKVDIVDRHAVSEAFGRIIDAAPKAALR